MQFLRVISRKLILLSQLSRVNLKTSLIIIIGLTVALSMISSSFIFVDTNRERSYRDILENSEFSSGIEFQHSDTARMIDYPQMLRVKRELTSELISFNLGKFFIPNPLAPYYTFDSTMMFFNQSRAHTLIGFDYDQSILANCVNGSRMPATSNETIVFSFVEEPAFQINESFILSYPFYPEGLTIPILINTSLNISGIITPSSLKESWLIESLSLESGYYLFSNITNYYPLMQTIRNRVEGILNVYWTEKTVVHFPYKLDQASIESHNVINFVFRLNEYLQSKRHIKKIFSIEDVRVSIAQTYSTFEKPVNETNNAMLTFIAFTIPILLLAFLIVNFSIGLNTERQKGSLVLLKTRGFSSRFVFLILSFETLILAFIATVIGALLGIPFSLVMINLLGPLNSSSQTSLLPITSSTIEAIILWGIIFTSVALFPSAFRLSKIKVVSLAEEASRKRRRRLDVFKGNIDIILLTQGVLGVFIFSWLTNIEELSEASTSLYLLLITLMFISPLAVLSSALFFYNRFIPSIITKLGDYCWKKDWRLLAIVSRNLYGNVNITRRVTLLIAVSISFLVIVSSAYTTVTQNRINQIYTEAGSDLTILVSDFSEVTIINFTEELEKIEGLSVTCVSTSAFQIWDSSFNLRNTNVLGIEDNFHQVVYWKDYFNDNSLEELVSSLSHHSNGTSVIIDSKWANDRNYEIGSSYIIYPEKRWLRPEGSTFSFTIQDISKSWPGFFDQSDKLDRYIVMDRQLLELYSDSINSRSIWGKISEKQNEDYILEQAWNVAQKYDIVRTDFRPTVEEVEKEFTTANRLIYVTRIITIFNLIGAMILISTVILFYTYIRITSHNIEIGLSRALGMKFFQIFMLMFTEPLLIFILSGLPGAIIGLIILIGSFGALSVLIGQGLTYFLYYDIPMLIAIFSSILILALLSGLVSSLMATRANVSKILKVE